MHGCVQELPLTVTITAIERSVWYGKDELLANVDEKQETELCAYWLAWKRTSQIELKGIYCMVSIKIEIAI